MQSQYICRVTEYMYHWYIKSLLHKTDSTHEHNKIKAMLSFFNDESKFCIQMDSRRLFDRNGACYHPTSKWEIDHLHLTVIESLFKSPLSCNGRILFRCVCCDPTEVYRWGPETSHEFFALKFQSDFIWYIVFFKPTLNYSLFNTKSMKWNKIL